MEPLLAHLLDAASRAPSAHNTQPWKLRWREDRLGVVVPADRMLAAADPTGNDVLHAVGAVLENLLLTLAQHGHEGRYETAARLEPGAAVLTLHWRASSGARPDATLYRMIPLRRTSRLPYRTDPVPAGVQAALREAARPCILHTLDDPAALDELRRLVAQATATQLADAGIARELHAWMRFSRRDPRWYLDGLNAACLGWGPVESAIARRLLAPRTLAILSRLGLHRALCADVNQQSPPAPMLCMLALRGDGVAQRIEAGRSLQRTWLTAAAHGLVTHPVSAALDVAATRPRALELMGLSAEELPVNLFRLGYSPPPARSPRLPADEILERGE